MVGLLPLCAATVIDARTVGKFPGLLQRVRRFLTEHPEVTANMSPIDRQGHLGRYLLGILNETKLRRVLGRLLDENELLSPYGIRSLSRYHHEHPCVVNMQGQEHRVDYVPGDSNSGMFGGNSNWRGPIWMPVNLLVIRGLLAHYAYLGEGFTVECPVGSGRAVNLFEVAREITGRLGSMFLLDAAGRRPVFGSSAKFQTNPHWRDHVLFYEYFHGDTGAGLGASHQTGWTGVVARLIQFFGANDADTFLESPLGLRLTYQEED